MAVKKGLACGSYVALMLPPFPCDPFHPSRPLEPSRPLFPLGVPMPPEPPRPPRPPFPRDPPEPPPAFTVSEPPGDPPATASACLLRIHSLGEGDGVLTGVPRGFALRARLLRLLRLGHSSHRSRLSRLRPRRDYSDPWNPCYRSCRPNHRCRSYRWNRCCRRNSR